MSKREIVLLVSRALALTQAVYGLVGATYVPEEMIFLTQRLKSHSVLVPVSLTSEPQFCSLIFYILRLVIITTAAMLFWKCGPRVSNWLLPEPEPTPESAS